MPEKKLHSWIDELLLQKRHSRVHAALDRPVKYLGRSHRRLYHNPLSAMIVARQVSSDRDAPLAALIHLGLDQYCSKQPIGRKTLELLMMLQKEKRSAIRRHGGSRARRRSRRKRSASK